MSLSGPQWVAQFPESTSPDDLVEPFRSHVNRFLAALKAAGASVSIACTLRPAERAYLMHYAFGIARLTLDPASIPALAKVDIQWVHPDGNGTADVTASRKAAELMVEGYGIVFAPVLKSRHTEGNAIDMDISWQGALTIADANGKPVKITTPPRAGSGNTRLQAIGASYGVHKLASDPPHWSVDGH
jgi:hypothetical protein